MKYLFLIVTLSMSAFAEEYPTAMLARPFTMPKNSFESSLLFKNSAVGIMSTNYGITNDFQLGLSWGGFSAGTGDLSPDMKMAVNAGYFLFANRFAATMVNASLPFHFNSNVLQKISFDLTTSVPLIRNHLALLLFYDDLVALDWSNGLKANFNFPIRLNWQATQQLYLKLGTNIANLSTTGEHKTIADKTPLHFSTLYAVNKSVDILAQFGFDNVQNASDMVMMLGVAFRGGDIDG